MLICMSIGSCLAVLSLEARSLWRARRRATNMQKVYLITSAMAVEKRRPSKTDARP